MMTKSSHRLSLISLLQGYFWNADCFAHNNSLLCTSRPLTSGDVKGKGDQNTRL